MLWNPRYLGRYVRCSFISTMLLISVPLIAHSSVLRMARGHALRAALWVSPIILSDYVVAQIPPHSPDVLHILHSIQIVHFSQPHCVLVFVSSTMVVHIKR